MFAIGNEEKEGSGQSRGGPVKDWEFSLQDNQKHFMSLHREVMGSDLHSRQTELTWGDQLGNYFLLCQR